MNDRENEQSQGYIPLAYALSRYGSDNLSDRQSAAIEKAVRELCEDEQATLAAVYALVALTNFYLYAEPKVFLHFWKHIKPVIQDAAAVKGRLLLSFIYGAVTWTGSFKFLELATGMWVDQPRGGPYEVPYEVHIGIDVKTGADRLYSRWNALNSPQGCESNGNTTDSQTATVND